MNDERAIHRMLEVAAHEARANQSIRIHIGIAEKLISIRDHAHARAALETHDYAMVQ